MNENNGIKMFLLIVLAVAGGTWLYQSMAFGPQALTKEKYIGSIDNGFPYARLGGGYNTQLFSPCISKRCAGGPYMYTSNPYLQAVCQGISGNELARETCGRGFNGKPIKFDYTSLSDGAWDNALCNTPSVSSLCVL